MATWIAHLRIAERVLEHLDLDEKYFALGNIGPDSGILREDKEGFDPPKEVTHWLNPEIEDNGVINIDSEAFYREHIQGKEESDDYKKRAFMIGYYTHLITDIQWSKFHKMQRDEDPSYEEKLKADKMFIWEVKKDWYGIDFKYLKDNEKNIFTDVFKHIKEVPDYMEGFPEGAIKKNVEYIQEYYSSEDSWVNTEFVYFTEERMNMIVDETVKIVLETLREKEII